MSLGLASLVVALLAAGAAWLPTDSRNILINAPLRAESLCNTLLLGQKADIKIKLDQRAVAPHGYLFIANYCSGQQKKLVGEYVKVCDSAGAFPPSVCASAGRFSPLRVDCAQQNEPCSALLSVDITLYCEDPPNVNVI